MAKCLVTGGLGFIGSNLVDTLIEQGHEVAIIDDLSTGVKKNLNKKALFVEADINKIGGLDYKPDYIFHLAALARIQPSIDNPVESHRVNLTGTLAVLEFCRKHKAKIIFSSSSSVYPGNILPTRETDPIQPKNPYALQKYLSEQYIQLYAELYGLRYTIFRYFNVWGPRQILTGAYAAVVGIFLNQRKKGMDITITGTGEQRRDFTHVSDVVAANLLAMDKGDQDIFNIGTGENLSINELADRVGGAKLYLPPRAGEVEATLADISKARVQLGWEPKVFIKNCDLEAACS